MRSLPENLMAMKSKTARVRATHQGSLSEEKKTHPKHKYSVTFASKVGTKIRLRIKFQLKFHPNRNLVGQFIQIDNEHAFANNVLRLTDHKKFYCD